MNIYVGHICKALFQWALTHWFRSISSTRDISNSVSICFLILSSYTSSYTNPLICVWYGSLFEENLRANLSRKHDDLGKLWSLSFWQIYRFIWHFWLSGLCANVFKKLFLWNVCWPLKLCKTCVIKSKYSILVWNTVLYFHEL